MRHFTFQSDRIDAGLHRLFDAGVPDRLLTPIAELLTALRDDTDERIYGWMSPEDDQPLWKRGRAHLRANRLGAYRMRHVPASTAHKLGMPAGVGETRLRSELALNAEWRVLPPARRRSPSGSR